MRIEKTSPTKLSKQKWNWVIFILVIFYIPLNGQNVGIGTTNPTEKLTVDGTVLIERNSGASAPQLQLHETAFDYARIKFTNSETPSYFSIAARPAADSTQSRFNLFNSDFDGNIFTATASGRFGVNTVPSATLHSNSEAGSDPFRVQNNGNTKFRMFSNNAMVLGANWANPVANTIRVETPNMFIGFDGNHVPEQRLEVDGDVRITGGIKANEVNGTPGQVLTTGSDGNLAWSSPCHYNRFFGFPQAGTIAWTVPVGVTEIMVELWGAGGGAHNGGGGGSGGYAKAIFEVMPGDVLTIVTGSGGQGEINAIQSASDGGPSTITGTNVFAAVLGGKNAVGNTPGAGGTYSIILPYISAAAQIGETGHYNVTLPIYAGTTKTIHGRGGQSPNAAKNYGLGDTIIDSDGSIDYNRGTSGNTPGGGGGGGSNFGHSGGDGYVIIRWN